MASIDHVVFVYGTLTDPNRARAILSTDRGPTATGRSTDTDSGSDSTGPQFSFVGPATLGGLHRVDGRYPTLAPGGEVDGRLLTVDDAALERLDRYEGVDRGLYVRVAVPRASDEKRHPVADQEPRRERARKPVWTYVGDPNRVGVDEPVTWPGDGTFERRVRRYIDDRDITVVIDSG